MMAESRADRILRRFDRRAEYTGFLITLPQDVRAFLDAPLHAVVATHTPDGEIWQAVVWYALQADGVLMNSLFGRRWSDNLRHDPRLSMTVFDGEDYVILRGRAVVVDDADRAMAEARALARLYGRDPNAHTGQHRVRVVFRPERAGMHGRFERQTAARGELDGADQS